MSRPFALADVGGRYGPSERWRTLPVEIVCFEPDVAECERLRVANPNVRYEPVALAAQPSEATLYLTRDPACASLYQPDPDVIAAYPALKVAEQVGATTVQTETLDGWCAAHGVSFDALKLDVQGAELDVLQGAERQLESVVMLEVEVEFNPIYQGQPLFGDVDAFLRARGFELWRLGHLVHYGQRGQRGDVQFFDDQPVAVAARGGQLFWGHAWYVAQGRDPGVALQGFGFS